MSIYPTKSMCESIRKQHLPGSVGTDVHDLILITEDGLGATCGQKVPDSIVVLIGRIPSSLRKEWEGIVMFTNTIFPA